MSNALWSIDSTRNVWRSGFTVFAIAAMAWPIERVIASPQGDAADIITSNVVNMSQLGREGPVGSGTVGLGVGSTMCNKGTTFAIEALPQVMHPVIEANLFRLRNDEGYAAFEQIGQAWLKHTFGSNNLDECNAGCDCSTGECTFKTLAAGCADTYFAEQFFPCNMGPRSMIHPFTGAMPGGDALGGGGGCGENYPSANHLGHDHVPGFPDESIDHRLQVRDVDLLPGLNTGARYFAQVQYITPAEFATGNGNQHNNASHREYSVSGPDENGEYTFLPVSSTMTESPALDAWSGAAQNVIEPYPLADGRAIVAYEVTKLGGGIWHYEYLIYNLNLDAGIGSLRIPVSSDVDIQAVEFHAPAAHGPQANAESYSTEPWTVTRDADGLLFATSPHAVDPLANAIRFGTAYNFRFRANAAPIARTADAGIFKTGDVELVTTLAPGTAIPAVSSWSMLILALLVTISATVLLRRPA